jgi:hypothetical protein
MSGGLASQPKAAATSSAAAELAQAAEGDAKVMETIAAGAAFGLGDVKRNARQRSHGLLREVRVVATNGG